MDFKNTDFEGGFLFLSLVGCNVTEMKQGEISDHLSLAIMKSSEMPEGVVIVQGWLNSIPSKLPSSKMHLSVRCRRRGKRGENSPNRLMLGEQ